MFSQYPIFGAFLLGLLHVLEPCEDKAIVSFYVGWAGSNLKHTLKLILLYGLGMMIINICFGFIISFLGANYLSNWQAYLQISAGFFVVIFGFFIALHSHLFGKNHCLLDHYNVNDINVKSDKSILAMGLLRGMPLCPIEISMMLWAASMGNIFYGTSLIASFSFGTALSLIPFGLSAKGIFQFIEKRSNEKVKKIIQLLIGISIMITGILTIIYLH